VTPPVSKDALLQLYIGKHHTPRTKREKCAKATPVRKKQPQDSNQEAPGSGSSRLPRRLRRADFTEVPGRGARPQFVATTGVHIYTRVSTARHVQELDFPTQILWIKSRAAFLGYVCEHERKWLSDRCAILRCHV
jgi:hypothetical protein